MSARTENGRVLSRSEVRRRNKNIRMGMEWMDVHSIAEAYAMSERHVRRLFAERCIPYTIFGLRERRAKRKDVEKWAASRRYEAISTPDCRWE